MILKWVFIITLVLTAGFEASHAETLTKATHFDNYLEVLAAGRDIAEKIRIVEAVWGQIRAETPDDLLRVQTLYQQLKRQILDATNNPIQQQAAAEWQQEMRRHLVHRNAQLLANALNGRHFEDCTEIQQFCGNLVRNYDQALVMDIYERAIDEVYNFKETELLAAQLRSTYLHNVELASYEVMLKSQLYLFWKFQNRRDINDLYLFNVAYYFSGIQEDTLYQKVGNNTKRRLESAITALPSTLQFLFFRPSFCLLNKAHSEFFYTAIIYIDAERQQVYTWREPNSVASNGIWVKNLTEVSVGSPKAPLNLEFSLQSLTVDHQFMYLERNVSSLQDMIVSWRPGNAPPGSRWSLQLVENQLVFSQNAFAMCVNSTVFDKYRRFVHGYRVNERTSADPECQWIAKACP